jgi:glutaredoxin
MDEPRKKVRVYALSTCPVCGEVRRFLEGHRIQAEYIEVDLLQGGEQWVQTKELKRYNPLGTYPTTVIEEVVTGFDEERLRGALDVS